MTYTPLTPDVDAALHRGMVERIKLSGPANSTEQTEWVYGYNVVNVKDHGAKGDGTTDDATSIQAAIDAAPDGALVHFPVGVYIVGATIKLKANGRYAGESRLRSWVKMKAGANLHAVLASESWAENAATTPDNPIHIEHLRIDGNKANQTSGSGHGIALNNFWSTLENLYITDTRGDGILLSTARQDGTENGQAVENMVYRCDTRQIDGNGIHVYDPDPVTAANAPDGYISHCKVETTLGHGIWVEGSAGWSISENHVYGARKSGIKCDRLYATSIVNNYIESVGTSATPGYYAGIDCQGFAGSTVPSIIADNRGVQSMGGVSASSNIYGIYVYASNGVTTALSVIGNGFLGATHATTSHGLVLECQGASAIIRCHVAGNRMLGWDTNNRPILNSGTFDMVGDMFAGYQVITWSSTVQPNTHIGNIMAVTLGGNTTIAAPFSALAGEQITFLFTQDANGTRTVTFNSVFKKAGGAFTASTGNGAMCSISFTCDGTNWRETARAMALA